MWEAKMTDNKRINKLCHKCHRFLTPRGEWIWLDRKQQIGFILAGMSVEITRCSMCEKGIQFDGRSYNFGNFNKEIKAFVEAQALNRAIPDA